MTITSRIILVLAISATLTVEAYAGAVITRMSDRQIVNFSQLISDLKGSDLILIGESHDKMSHHDMELALIGSLWSRNLPLAIGMEMIQTDSQQQLDDWIEGRLNETAIKAVFAQNWSRDWHMYRAIFIFARDHRIPMVALNIPNGIVRKVAHQGYAALTPDEKKDLPQGTTCDLNNPHTSFLVKTFRGVAEHAANGKVFTHFCEAQTLRNSGMAINIARYARKYPGRKIVALTGIWHAVRNAVPEQLERTGTKLACTVILPEISELNTKNATEREADYMIGL